MMLLPVGMGWIGGGRYLSMVVMIGMVEVIVLAAGCQSQSFISQPYRMQYGSGYRM